MRTFLALCLLLIASSVAAQQPTLVINDAGMFRFYQAGTEVGRETFRRSGGAFEQTITVPLLSMRIESRSEFGSDGHLSKFSSRAYDLGNDSLRYAVTVAAAGDSLQANIVARQANRSATIPGPADGAVPSQSIAAIAEVVERSAGRDTVFHLYVADSPQLLDALVRHSGDSAFVTMARVQAVALVGKNGIVRVIEVPAQHVRAERWSGDSLVPLAGMKRPSIDYSAPTGAPYTTQEVRIPVRSIQGDTFSLAGTLVMPVGKRPVPVALFISGSGGEPRDEELWPLVPNYRPFRQIADRLARAGVASLRFDDRGIDASGGDAKLATTADLADDVRQLVFWLRSQAGIAPDRIAIIGHSEGGAIGPLVAAADPRIAAVVVMAGPGKGGLAILRDQFKWPIETAHDLSTAQRDSQLAQVDQAVDDWSKSSPWTRWFAAYDPLPTARKVHQPVLILQGALDRQISAGQADTLAAAFRAGGNRDVTVHVYPRLNHLFVPTDGDGSPSEYPTLPNVSIPNDVLDAEVTWLKARLGR